MHLKGKRLALLGFGVENRALGTWLAAQGLSYTVCDGDTACRAGDSAVVTDAATRADVVDEWRPGDHAVSDHGVFDIRFSSPSTPGRQPARAPALR